MTDNIPVTPTSTTSTENANDIDIDINNPECPVASTTDVTNAKAKDNTNIDNTDTKTDTTNTDTNTETDTVDQISNLSSSEIDSDSDSNDNYDDNESDMSEPPIILDSDDEAPPLPVKYTTTMTPLQLQQQTTLQTREALTTLGHQQARQMLDRERLDKYITSLFTSISSNPCYLSMTDTIKREDLDLTVDIDDSRHKAVFDTFKIAKTNLGHKRYLLQQAMYHDLLCYKITTLTKNLEASRKQIKEVEQTESEWVSQLDQADQNLTKVSKYWESRYKILEGSLTLHQKHTRLLKISWVATILLLQYINWWGLSSLTGMVWTLFASINDTLLYLVKTAYQHPLSVFGILLIASGYVMYNLYNQNKSLREKTNPSTLKQTKSKKKD